MENSDDIMYNDDHTSMMEPVILIEDDEEECSKEIIENVVSRQDPTDLMKCFGPDISIIPIKRKQPLFKIRLIDKKKSLNNSNNYPKNDSFNYMRNTSRGPRGTVRLISQEEAELAPETYHKRKSSPLEMCPICKKYFRRMSTHLLKHEFIQSDMPSSGLTCHFCNKGFNTHSNLLIHIRTHTGQKPYICEICNKAFSQSCNLVNHMRIHSGEKPFKCPHCEKAFTQSGNLNNHIRLHTNEKPFQCHFCDKAFVQSGNLNSHIKNNHTRRWK